MAQQHTRDIIVVGASSGGLAALRGLVGQLPDDLGAAVFIVQHCHATSDHMLRDILSASARLPVEQAENGRPIEPNKIVLAPPDLHLILEPDKVRLSRGPRENMARPAIDVLFRSAAVSFGPRTIGAVLTGQLNDGAVGLCAIKRCGGVAVVQDPEAALYPEMPEAALAATEVDHCVPLDALGPLLARLAGEQAGPKVDVPDEIRVEARMAAFENLNIASEQSIGNMSGLSCPECHGPLWEMRGGGPIRFRCHVGHAFTAEAALERQNEEIERALWMAFRILRDRGALARRAAEEAQRSNRPGLARMWIERIDEVDRHADALRTVLSRPPDGVDSRGGPHQRDATERSPHSRETATTVEPDLV
jgi:two-component system chemotaxis response regulator CheB